MKTSHFFSDSTTRTISCESDLESVREAHKYASDMFEVTLKELKTIDAVWNTAVQTKQPEASSYFNQLFYRLAGKVQFYSDETDRLSRIWSDKTGSPVFLDDETTYHKGVVQECDAAAFYAEVSTWMKP